MNSINGFRFRCLDSSSLSIHLATTLHSSSLAVYALLLDPPPLSLLMDKGRGRRELWGRIIACALLALTSWGGGKYERNAEFTGSNSHEMVYLSLSLSLTMISRESYDRCSNETVNCCEDTLKFGFRRWIGNIWPFCVYIYICKCVSSSWMDEMRRNLNSRIANEFCKREFTCIYILRNCLNHFYTDVELDFLDGMFRRF